MSRTCDREECQESLTGCEGLVCSKVSGMSYRWRSRSATVTSSRPTDRSVTEVAAQDESRRRGAAAR